MLKIVSGVAFVVICAAGMALMMLPSAVPLLRLDYETERSGFRTAGSFLKLRLACCRPGRRSSPNSFSP